MANYRDASPPNSWLMVTRTIIEVLRARKLKALRAFNAFIPPLPI